MSELEAIKAKISEAVLQSAEMDAAEVATVAVHLLESAACLIYSQTPIAKSDVDVDKLVGEMVRLITKTGGAAMLRQLERN